eukprot:GEMP01012809.1.p1 GENE.GEMP01012809.1~~GEMP01012809.1.p1  ORF type:complete len:699 (+),score=128.30 GEMP01012809.1:179-2275(+)
MSSFIFTLLVLSSAALQSAEAPEKFSGPRRLAEKCSTGDPDSTDVTLADQGFVCQRVVKESTAADAATLLTIHYGYDTEKDQVKFAVVSEKNGYFAFGPAENSTSGAVLVASNGTRNGEAWGLAATSAAMQKRLDLAWLDHKTTKHVTKRMVQFAMPSSQMSGSLEDANFAYLYSDTQNNLENAQSAEFNSGVVSLKVGQTTTTTTTAGTISQCQRSSFPNAAVRGLTCMQPIPNTDKLDIHWGLDNEAKTVSLGIVHRGTGWVGFGVGTSMSDGTALIMSDDANGGEIFKLRKQQKPQEKTTELEAKKVRLAKSNDGRTSTFTIPQSKLVGGVEKASFIWAFGTSAVDFRQHALRSRGSFDIDLKSGRSAMATKPTTPDFIWAHIVLMAWAVFGVIPMAIFLAVFAGPGFKLGPKWFYGHWMTMIFGLVIMATALTLALLASPFDTTHGILGCVAFGCMALQPLTGFLRVDKDHPKRPVWEFIHKGLGRVAMILALVTAVLGGEEFRISYKSSSFVIITAVFLGLVLLCWIGLMIRQVLGNKDEPDPLPAAKNRTSTTSAPSTMLGRLHKQQTPEDQVATLTAAQMHGASPRAAPMMLTPAQGAVHFGSPTSIRTIPEEQTQARDIAHQNMRAYVDTHLEDEPQVGAHTSGAIRSGSQVPYIPSPSLRPDLGMHEDDAGIPKFPTNRRKKGKLRKIQ